MRNLVASVLVGIGAFLLVAAALLRFYAPDRAVKTPLDLDITQTATGPATYGGTQVQLKATRHVSVDSAASDSTNIVVVESLCIVVDKINTPACVSANDPQKRLVSVTTDRVAANRRSGQSVNDNKYDEYVNSDKAVKHEGLSYKWPFSAKKTGYKFFDPASLQSPVAQFQRTESVAGIDCYVYTAVEKNISVDVVAGTPGKYDDTRTVWVDPVTGTIVKGVEHQVRRLASGETALDTTLTFDKKSIDYQANKAKDGRNQINLLTKWLPLLGLVLGLLALIGGLVLLGGNRNAGQHRDDGSAPDEGTLEGEPTYAPGGVDPQSYGSQSGGASRWSGSSQT